MKIKVKFSHIDVLSVINSDKKESEISLISKIKTKAADSAIKHVPSLVESVIEKKLKALICKYDAGVELETTVLLKKEHNDELYGVAFLVSKIDYVCLFRALKPFILKATVGFESGDVFKTILSIIGNDCDCVISSTLSALSDEKKTKIIGLLACRYNKKICNLLNEAAKNRDIDIVIEKITVSH